MENNRAQPASRCRGLGNAHYCNAGSFRPETPQRCSDSNSKNRGDLCGKEFIFLFKHMRNAHGKMVLFL